MVDSTNMATPVTRGELRAELEQFEIRLDQKLVHLATQPELEQRFAHLAIDAREPVAVNRGSGGTVYCIRRLSCFVLSDQYARDAPCAVGISRSGWVDLWNAGS